MREKPILRLLLKISMVIVLFWLGVLAIEWAIPRFVDLPAIKQEIETTVARDVFAEEGWALNIDDLRVNLSWEGARARFLDVKLTSPEGKSVLSSSAFTATVRYWPLIIGGTPELSRVDVDDLTLTLEEEPRLKPESKGKTARTIPKTTSKAKPSKSRSAKAAGPKKPPVVPKNMAVVVHEHDVHIGPWLDGTSRWKVQGHELKIDHFFSEIPFWVHIDTTVAATTPDDVSMAALRQLAHVDISTELPHAVLQMTAPPDDIAMIHDLRVHLGEISLTDWQWLLERYGIEITGTGHVGSVELTYRNNQGRDDQAPLKEQLRFTAQSLDQSRIMTQGYKFVFEPGYTRFETDVVDRQLFDHLKLVVESAPYRFKAEGLLRLAKRFDVEDVQGKHIWDGSEMDVRLNTTMLPVDLLRVLPDVSPLGQLFEQSGGLVQLNLHLDGPIEEPHVHGDIRLEDLAFTHQKLDPTTWDLVDGGLEHVYGKIQFRQRDVVLDHLEGELNGTPFKLSGEFNPDDQLIRHGVAQSEHLDVNDLRLTLLHFASIFDIRLPKEMKRLAWDGFFVVDLKASGALERPDVRGSLGVHGVGLHSFRHPDQQLFHDLNSVLNFGKGVLTFLDSRVLVGQQAIEWTGTYDLRSQTVDVQVTGESLEMGDLLKSAKKAALALGQALPESVLGRAELSGVLQVALDISGVINAPEVRGDVTLQHVGLTDSETGLGVQNVQGKIAVSNSEVALKNLQGLVGTIPFALEGGLTGQNWAALNRYRFHLVSHAIHLASVETMLNGVQDWQGGLPFSDLKGVMDVDLTAQGDWTDEKNAVPQFSGYVSLDEFSIKPANLGATVRIDPVKASFNESGRLVLPKSTGYFGQLAFDFEGKASPRFDEYEFSFDTGRVSASLLNSQRKYFKNVLGLDYRPLERTRGTFQVQGTATPGQRQAQLTFDQMALAWTNLPAIHNLNGHIRVALDETGHPTVESEDLFFDLHALHVANHFSAIFEKSPARAAAQGLPIKVDAEVDIRVSHRDQPDADPVAIIEGELHEKGHRLVLDNTAVRLKDVGLIRFDGLIEYPLTPDKRGFNMKVHTPKPLQLNQFGALFTEPFRSGGTASLDVGFVGHGRDDTLLVGEIELDRLQIAPLRLLDITGKLVFDGVDGSFDFKRLYLPGVLMAAKGDVDDTMAYPVPLKDVRIDGKLFVVPAWELFVKDVGEALIYEQIVKPLFGPRKPDDPIVPVEFRGAELIIDEVIYDNVIFSNLDGIMHLNGSGFFELEETEVETAGGKVLLDLSMNPKQNHFTSARIEVQSVEANALARALLEAPNQIFGKLNGHILFTTQGQTDADMMNNANGMVDFVITDGRLPAIAKIETLLAGANVIRGGILGLNLNNLVRALSPFDTNYFAELSGSLQITEGMSYTDDLLSDGENLDLLIEGRIRLLDGDADLTVHGSMNQNISGVFGKLGKLSIHSLVKFVPGLGFLPGSKKGGILSFVPGLGYVPGLGGRAKALNHFQVKIQGPLDDPKSVQSFEWKP